MKSRLFLGILITALLMPAAAEAQEAPEGGRLVEAAEQAGLGTNYSWNFWNDLFTYWFVFPVESMAYFDDPEQMMRQIQGTPGEAALNEAISEFNDLSMRTVSSEVAEVVPAWGYQPNSAGASELSMAMVGEYWLKPGMAEQWDAMVQDYIAFLRDLDYPYTIFAYRIRFGDDGRRTFATLYDTQEAYYGANSIENLAAQKGMTEAWEGILARFITLVVDAKQTTVAYVPEMSFVPEN